MLATRDGFGKQLAISGECKKIVVLGADLSKATKTNLFRDKYPDRFFEIGIAEANMIGIASGISEYGYRVFISSFASFLTGRYDIIRCSLAYSECPVVIVGTHSGMAIGRDGVTQMGLEDINIMRGIPGMDVIQPASYIEAIHATKYLAETNRLSYFRIGRQPVEECFTEDYKFEFGKGVIVKKGSKDIVVFSTGCVLPEVLKAMSVIDKKIGTESTVINIHTIKPIDKDLIFQYSDSSLLVTVEDHSIIGGLGSAVSEVITDKCMSYVKSKRLLRIGINDQFVESGTPSDLYKKYSLSSDGICNKILETIS